MRSHVAGCGVVVCAAWLAALSALARAETVVPWQSAGVYEGDVVTVEGDVARARLEADTCVLEFAPDDPKAFRVVLVIPLMSDLPLQPQRLYDGKRVRATGKVRSWKGRPEMILRSPGSIEVVGVSSAAPQAPPPPSAPAAPPPTRTTLPPTTTTTTPPPPPPPPPPAAVSPPVVAPAPAAPSTTQPPVTVPPTPPPTVTTTTLPAPAVAPPPPPTADEPLRLPRRVDPCEAARERWRRAAAAADARAAELSRCLRSGGYRCRAESAAMGAPLSELEWAEQQVEAACP
jgi:hypothetical protein